jgi:hypothetical protein
MAGGIVFNKKYHFDYTHQSVRGIFFIKRSASRDECRKLVQDLGCVVINEHENTLTIQATRGRLRELKQRHQACEDDKAQISSRLKNNFERILIGGNSR